MTKKSFALTDYPEINSVLQELLSGARDILGDHFVGMYLDGSLAIGEFEPDKSDLDFVVVTDSDVSSDTFGDLKAMHCRKMGTGSARQAVDAPHQTGARVVPRGATRP